MASTYPTSLDAFTNPTATSLLTSPSHAQQHSDINDAVEALETKVAIGNTVLGTYTSYTPTWTSGITIGNGTFSSFYARVNDFVHYYGIFFWGTTTVGSTNPVITLPISSAASFSGYSMPLGSATYHDISAGLVYQGEAQPSTATGASFKVGNTAGTYNVYNNVNSTVPMTWVSTDRLQWNLYYKAA